MPPAEQEDLRAVARALVSLRDEIGRLRAAVVTTGGKGDATTKAIEALAGRVDTLERSIAPLVSAEAAARAEGTAWRQAVRTNPLVYTIVVLLILSGGALIVRGDALAVLGWVGGKTSPVAPVPATEPL